MNYTKEDYNFIKSWLDKCATIQLNDNIIYYVTSPNIVRQLKYNRILKTKKEIQINLTDIIMKDVVILKIDFKYKKFWINFNKIWSPLKNNHGYKTIVELINNILSDIFNLNDYTIGLYTGEYY